MVQPAKNVPTLAELGRRHLSESQRAMVAAKLATLKLGSNQHTRGSANLPTLPQADAAKALNVSERSVRHAVVVREKGTPELAEAVERGQVPVSAVANLSPIGGKSQGEATAPIGAVSQDQAANWPLEKRQICRFTGSHSKRN